MGKGREVGEVLKTVQVCWLLCCGRASKAERVGLCLGGSMSPSSPRSVYEKRNGVARKEEAGEVEGNETKRIIIIIKSKIGTDLDRI